MTVEEFRRFAKAAGYVTIAERQPARDVIKPPQPSPPSAAVLSHEQA